MKTAEKLHFHALVVAVLVALMVAVLPERPALVRCIVTPFVSVVRAGAGGDLALHFLAFLIQSPFFQLVFHFVCLFVGPGFGFRCFFFRFFFGFVLRWFFRFHRFFAALPLQELPGFGKAFGNSAANGRNSC